MSNIKKGIYGEKLAVEYLLNNKYKILEKNYRNQLGEIDIITLYKDIIIFIEVKSRNCKKYGYPREAVDKRKQNKIILVSLLFIQENNIIDRQFRYDIIEVYLYKNRINHIKNAYNLDGHNIL